MGFLIAFVLVDNYFDDGVPSQRNKKNQAVSRGLADFFCCMIAGPARWLCPIHGCIRIFRHRRLVSFRSQMSFCFLRFYVPTAETLLVLMLNAQEIFPICFMTDLSPPI